NSGNKNLTLNGGGTLKLEATNTYLGTTIIGTGSDTPTLLVNGEITSTQNVTINSGATLGGSGKVDGTVGALGTNTGIISPGSSYGSTGTGILTTGAVSFASGSAFDVDLNGTTAGTGYDQLKSTGALSLGTTNTTLNLAIGPNFSATQGQTFTII